jgi:ribosome-associated translation inhibitor RaiA
MRKNLKVTNMSLTAEDTDYLDKRLGLLDKLILVENRETAMLDVEVGRTTAHHQSGDVYRAEFNLHVGSKHFRSVSEKSDLLSAIDDAKDQLAEELRTSHDKQLTIARRGAKMVKDMIRGLYRR